MTADPRHQRPPQQQSRQPGIESEMVPRPRAEDPGYRGSGKLRDKVAVITGGDSGIGRAVAIAFAREGADVVIVYLDEHDDAAETRRRGEAEGARCLTIAGDVGREDFCRHVIERTLAELGRVDVVVNNGRAASPAEPRGHHGRAAGANLPDQHLRLLLPDEGRAPAPGQGQRDRELDLRHGVPGQPHPAGLLGHQGRDRRLHALAGQGARRAGHPGERRGAGAGVDAADPVHVPAEKVQRFGDHVPMKRAGEPEEIAPAYVFLASDDASYMTGQVLHPNGGEVVNG